MATLTEATVQVLKSQSEQLLSQSESEEFDTLNMGEVIGSSSEVLDLLMAEFDCLDPDDPRQKDYMDLVETVQNLKAVTDSLIVRLSELSEKNVSLEDEVQKMSKKIQKLEKDQQKLTVGQIAHLLDEAILTKVMKSIGVDDYKKRSIYTIFHLEKAIENQRRFGDAFHTEDERKKAREAWDNLKSDIGWEDHHFRQISQLKGFRIDSAHPDVSLEDISKAIKLVFSESRSNCHYLKPICEEFLEMLQKAREAHA